MPYCIQIWVRNLECYNFWHCINLTRPTCNLARVSSRRRQMESHKLSIDFHSPPSKLDCQVGCGESDYFKLDDLLSCPTRSLPMCAFVNAVRLISSNHTFNLKSHQNWHPKSCILGCNTFDFFTPIFFYFTNSAAYFEILKSDEPCLHSYQHLLDRLDVS